MLLQEKIRRQKVLRKPVAQPAPKQASIESDPVDRPLTLPLMTEARS